MIQSAVVGKEHGRWCGVRLVGIVILVLGHNSTVLRRVDRLYSLIDCVRSTFPTPS
jgi:hypothetical protein